MSIIISTLIQLTLAYCLIIFLVLTLRDPLYKIAGARWVYVLWFTLLVPLIVLVLPTAMLSPFIPLPMQELALHERVNSIVSFNSLSIFTIALAVLWVGGVIVTSWRNVRTNSRLAVGVKANCQQLSTHQLREFDRLCRKSGVFPSPEIRYSTVVDGPALFGVVNPLLLLPVQFFDKFNRSEQALMICHELVHYRRKDTWWNLLFCILRCVFWFNPLIGLAESRFRLDQELSCDQSVLCDEPLSQRAHYAAAMLKASSPASSSSLIGFLNNSPEILSRVERLHHHKVSPAQSVFGPVGLALLLVIATVLSTPLSEDGYSSSVTSGWCDIYQNLGL